MKSQHLKVFFVWFAHTPLSTSLMDGKISSSRLSANMIWEYKPNLDPELGQDSVMKDFKMSFHIERKSSAQDIVHGSHGFLWCCAAGW